MQYIVFSNGIFDSNVYLVYEDKDAVIIDAGVPAKEVLDEAGKLGLTVHSVLLTHGHIDHIAYAEEYRSAGIPVAINKREGHMLLPCRDNLAKYLGIKYFGSKADELFVGGDVLEFGKLKIKVILTPGHTSGSCCFYCDNACFTGDTLFAGAVGRTDFPTGNHSELISSIKEKLLSLPEDTVILPGHNGDTTLKAEKYGNAYIVNEG